MSLVGAHAHSRSSDGRWTEEYIWHEARLRCETGSFLKKRLRRGTAAAHPPVRTVPRLKRVSRSPKRPLAGTAFRRRTVPEIPSKTGFSGHNPDKIPDSFPIAFSRR